MTGRCLHGAILALFAVTVHAADGPVVSIPSRAKPVPRSDIRVDTSLVLVPVSVTDPKNHPVVGIDPHQFRIFEGKAEQEIVTVSSDDAPVSIGIVFDSSASMAAKLPKAREAVSQFLQDSNPEDEFFLVNFSNTAELTVPFTNNGSEIQNRLMYAATKGKTALLDAVYLSLNAMKSARNQRRALLIISDGGDNDSRYTETEIRRAVRETGVWIYAIGVYGKESVILPEEESGGPKLLTDLAAETGGRHFAAHDASELPAAAAAISMELRNQYLVGFRPAANASDGKFHKVQVKLVNAAGLLLTWRPGYYAPGQ